LYRLMRRATARQCLSGAIGVSRFMARQHEPYIQGPVQSLSLGVNLSGRPIQRPERPRTPLRFGFVAGFQTNKGIWDVIDSAASLKRCGLEFELHIWGPCQESDHNEISSRGLEDRVFFHGMYRPEEVWSVYNDIDIAIMATTVCEPLGRVPLEAAAVGVPTIAPAIGGILETIRDNVDGLLYRFRDPNNLERQMRRVLEEPGLVAGLIRNLQTVPDTKARVVDLEKYYFSVLGLAPEPLLATTG